MADEPLQEMEPLELEGLRPIRPGREEKPADYRTDLVQSEQKAQHDFDKTIMTLAGGALGISLTFIKDVIGTKPINDVDLLLWAWIAWGVSLTSTLISFFVSNLAIRQAIVQVDNGTIRNTTPGGWKNWLTLIVNVAALLGFIVGVFLIIVFVFNNLR